MLWSTFVDGTIYGVMLFKHQEPLTLDELHALVEKNRIPGTPIEKSYLLQRLQAIAADGHLVEQDGKWFFKIDGDEKS